MNFRKAVKTGANLRLALTGPSGAGKTYTALRIAYELGERIALIDTEHGSASKYADEFDFDTLELPSFDPRLYIQAIDAARDYDVCIIDSLSHAWNGKGGVLQIVDQAAKKTNNKFSAWGEATPLHNDLIEAILSAPMHMIVTMRSKMAYAMQEVEDGGRKKTEVVKLGLEPVQRDGMEYEFDVIGDLDITNTLTVTKTRCSALAGQSFERPGPEIASVLKDWLSGERFTEEDRKKFHAVGSRAYGDEWEAKRHSLVKAITKGRTESSSQLTRNELYRLVEGMEARLIDSSAMITSDSSSENGQS